MPLYEGPADEAARMLKDGQMAVGNAPGGLPSASALAREARGLTPRLQTTWRAGSERSPLYRNPKLPAIAGETPGGHVVSVQKYKDDTRDWRKLHPYDVMDHFAELEKALRPVPLLETSSRGQKSSDLGSRPLIEGLIAAVAVGILQACNEHMYWSPCFEDDRSIAHDDLRLPMSRLVPASAVPDMMVLEARHEESPQVNILPDLSPIATCQMLAASRAGQRVALVRFTAASDRRSLMPSLNDHHEAQLFLQTTYLQALQDMPRHLHADPVQALEEGAVIYTNDVSILRGPIEGGAVWLDDAPLIDVLWVSLQRNPRSDDQGQYARIEEKARVVETIDRVFKVAAANGVDALVFPPLGVCGVAACNHPAADAGDLLRKAILEHNRLIKSVSVCQEYPGQLRGNWPVFAAALESGRTPVEHRELVPLTASPYLRPGWMAKKKRPPGLRGLGASSSSRPGNCAKSEQGSRIVSARTGEAVLGSAGRAIVC